MGVIYFRRVLLLVFVALVTLLCVWRLVSVQPRGTYGQLKIVALPVNKFNGDCDQYDDSCDAQTCGKLHDLSDSYRSKPPDGRASMLDEMRVCGLKPRLLSQVVPHDNGDALLVPNVVHYVFFKNNNNTMKFDFQHYLSFRSAHHFLRPQYIFLHGDQVPDGEWWKQTLKDVDNLYFVYTERPKAVHGKLIVHVEHASDIHRLNVLIGFGGIYLDTDILVLKSFNPLRHHDLVLARPEPVSISNGIIIACKGALFLRLWLENYRNYVSSSWARNSVLFSHSLHNLYPHLVHLEHETMLRPNNLNQRILYGDGHQFYNWSNNYCIHIYGETRYKVPKTPEQIKGFDSTLGQVMRYIYFGSAKLLPIKGKPFRPK